MGIAILWRHSRLDLRSTIEVDLGDPSNSRWIADRQGLLNKDASGFSKEAPKETGLLEPF